MKSTLLIGLLAGIFASGAALAQAASGTAPNAMSDKSKAKFEERFKAADTNGDGVISKEEAAKMPGLAKHFDRLDANKDGKLTREEMMAGHARGHGGKRDERGDRDAKFDQRFKAADKDGDGALSKAEVEAANMPHLAKSFDRIDTNKDGKITKEELHAAMKKLHEMRKQGKESLEGPKK